jgi:DDHD domain
MGSPIAATLIMRGQSVKDYKPCAPVKYYNVFSIYDPFAYRIEPLLDKRYIEISPVLWERPSAANKTFQLSYYKEMVTYSKLDFGLYTRYGLLQAIERFIHDVIACFSSFGAFDSAVSTAKCAYFSTC